MTIKVTYNVTDVYVTQDVSPVYINVSYSCGGGSGAAVWGGITGTLSDQTDLQNALDAKFDDPTGDTTQYIAGDGSLVAFPITGQAGTLVREVRNVTGATLLKGTVVYINGASGNKPTVAKAIATSDATSAQTFGLIQADIPNNSNGYLVAFGDLDGLDTSAFADGVQLYLSSTVLGGYTSTKQYAPAHLVYIGVITRSHPNQGRIEVRIQNGYEMDELHNVSAQNPNNNDGLFYNTSTSLWEHKQISTVLGYTPEQPLTFNSPISRSVNAVSIPQATGSVNGFLSSTDWTTFNNKQNALGYTPANAATTLTINGVTYDLSANRSWTVAGGISGSGASGQVAYWTGTSSQTGSNNLFWDAANSRLGIGTNAPQSTFSVKTSSANTRYIEFAQYSSVNYIESIDRGGGTSAPLHLYAGQTNSYISFTAGGTTEKMRIFGTTGNVSLQNGGTFTDTGERLQVTGTAVVKDITTSSVASALFQLSSTTKGFLPPRMTTTQKNAISSPAAGLVVYDTTLAKLCVYTTAWETITSA
jgi:hypothetical protein